MPVINDPTPAFLKPGNESVMDSLPKRMLRGVAKLLGFDDIQSQAMGLGQATILPFKKPAQLAAQVAKRQVERATSVDDILDILGPPSEKYPLDPGRMETLWSMSTKALQDSLRAMRGQGVAAEKMGPEWVRGHQEYWGPEGARVMRQELQKRLGMKLVK